MPEKPFFDPAQLTAWTASTQQVAIPEATATLMAAELGPATERALAALEHYDIEGEPAEFEALLNARAEQHP